MQQHLLHQHFACILHTKCNHGQTISNKYHIHAGMVGDVGAGEVMRRDHGDGFVLAVEALESIDGDRLACNGWCGT